MHATGLWRNRTKLSKILRGIIFPDFLWQRSESIGCNVGMFRMSQKFVSGAYLVSGASLKFKEAPACVHTTVLEHISYTRHILQQNSTVLLRF